MRSAEAPAQPKAQHGTQPFSPTAPGCCCLVGREKVVRAHVPLRRGGSFFRSQGHGARTTRGRRRTCRLAFTCSRQHAAHYCSVAPAHVKAERTRCPGNFPFLPRRGRPSQQQPPQNSAHSQCIVPRSRAGSLGLGQLGPPWLPSARCCACCCALCTVGRKMVAGRASRRTTLPVACAGARAKRAPFVDTWVARSLFFPRRLCVTT